MHVKTVENESQQLTLIKRGILMVFLQYKVHPLLVVRLKQKPNPYKARVIEHSLVLIETATLDNCTSMPVLTSAY